MKTATLPDLLRLDTREGIRRQEVRGIAFYLFRPYDLLTEGQELAIDVSSGVTQLRTAENTLVVETQLDLVEMRLFMVLALSYPCSVAEYQMLALCEMEIRDSVAMKEKLERALSEQRRDAFLQPLEDVIARCHRKIRTLGLMIVNRGSEYLLTSDQQEPEQVIAQGDAHHAHID